MINGSDTAMARAIISLLGAICSCLLGILGGIIISGSGYVTLREHAEFQKHIEDKFAGETMLITRQTEEIKASETELKSRLSALEGKLDVALGRRK
jgi:hypothetical protein